MASIRPPELIAQLDGTPDAGANCGMAASAQAVNFATQGARKPTPSQMRKRAGKPSGPGKATNTLNQKTAIESFDGKGEHDGNSDSTGGRMPLRYFRKLQEPWSTAQEALDAGKVVNVQIDYDVINDKAPGKSGDRNYTGDHSISLFGRRNTPTSDPEVRVFDPLYDGRHKGVPKGPQWVLEWVIRQAAEKFCAKKDAFTGGVIPVSPFPAPPPVDPPVEPPVVVPPVVSREDRYREALEQARVIIDKALDPVEQASTQVVVAGASRAIAEPPVDDTDGDG